MNLFIDTNIFLSFYHLTSDDLEELRKLAVLIEEKRVKLYLTDQVLSEFRRNRENKIADALRGLKNQRLSLQFPQMCKDYPEYPVLRDLQSNYDKAHSDLLKKLDKDIANETLKADEILKELFAKATTIASTDALIFAALRRVRVGNPPGKEGSLGDAINWETLLGNVTAGEDLYFITDDQDYVSLLDDCRFKDFLAKEWVEKRRGNVIYHRRLSSFFKDHFPDIKLASELEKELAIQALATTNNFASTHSAVAKLSKYTQFSAAQVNDIVRAVISNNQVLWIIADEDVAAFVNSVVSGREKDIQKENLNELQRLIKKASDATPTEDLPVVAADDDDVPF